MFPTKDLVRKELKKSHSDSHADKFRREDTW